MHGPMDQVYRQLRRDRTVEIRFLEHQEKGVEILRSNPHLLSLEIDGNKVTADLETDDEGIADLLDRLHNAGVRMRSFYDKDPTLEDVFMKVTKGLVT
jgi:ABC-2 type transport system ATP-binding protein